MAIEPAPTVRVLGIGSPHGSDQVGWRVVEQLERLLQKDQAVSGCVLTRTSRPTDLSILEFLSKASIAVVVDALIGRPLGSLERFEDLNTFESETTLSCHGLNLKETLALGQSLGEIPATFWIYGIGIGETAPSLSPSQLWEDQIQTHAERIFREICEQLPSAKKSHEAFGREYT